jgi:phosphoglycolate phosphatase-like HAD superfamily hydrolase
VLAMSGVEARYSEFMTEWLATIESPEMLVLDRVHPGAPEALRQLRENGHRLALVTSRQHEANLLDQLEAQGLGSSFDLVVVAVGAETGVKKAAAYTDRRPPSACSAWIGDTEVDIEAARVLGAPSFVVSNGLRTREYLTSLGPDFVYEDLVELARRHASYPIGPKI